MFNLSKSQTKMKLFLFTLFLCFICTFTNGQLVEPKFGKIEMSDMAMTKYDNDTTAGALILFDNGTSDFILNREMNFQFVYERHCQIKIFKKSAFNIGNISIRLYHSGKSKESLSDLKAVTYNLVGGKIEKTKLDNDNIYKAEGKNYTDMKFAFPEIKEGSIIEFAFAITSDFLYNFRGWTFQYSYPARWSQYLYKIPEYFNYQKSTKGYLNFDIMKNDEQMTTFSIPATNDDRNTGVGSFKRLSGPPEFLRATSKRTILGVRNVPAFIQEPNIDCEDNYIQSIEFELSSIQFPQQTKKDFTESWKSVNTKMKEDEDFGNLLKTSSFIKDTVNTVCKNKSSESEKAYSIYNNLQKRMKWNGDNRIWAMKGLKKPYTDGTGNSAEINMLLTLMLRNAGLKANPVMFSTRDNGIAITYYPTITKFNSVLCGVEIDGKTVLLDATNKDCPFGVLPPNDINGTGRVVNDLDGDWVQLTANEKFKETKSYTLEINADGSLTGSIIGNYEGYAGIFYRNQVNSEKTSDDYYRKQQENLNGLKINKYSLGERYNNDKPFSDTLNVEISDHVEMIGDKIIFSPLLFERMEKNRYTLEDRKYPVDYNYPISEVYIFKYILPAGYKVESLPQSVSLSLPNNSITVSFDVKESDNRVIVEYRRDITNILFLPQDYSKLKNLYDQIVKKHAEQIILTKSI